MPLRVPFQRVQSKLTVLLPPLESALMLRHCVLTSGTAGCPLCQALVLLQAAVVIVLVKQLGCHGRACGHCYWHVSSCDCAGGNCMPRQSSTARMVSPARSSTRLSVQVLLLSRVGLCYLPCSGLDVPV
jgi:hypothetical protein